MLTEGRTCFVTLHAGTSLIRRPICRKPSRAAALPIVAENRRQVTASEVLRTFAIRTWAVHILCVAERRFCAA